MPLNPNQLQDVARSNYADMLNDDERNRAYYLAIRITVRTLVTSKEHNPIGDRFFQCLDIGTGSGLLSMMIVSAFQELQYNKFHVQAVEEFKPMADCAKKVIERNGLSNSITVHSVRLDKLEGDWSFDLLVAELLDTELIGEGCINAYKFAVEHFCSPTCLFVPHKAIIYLEPVASAFLFQRHAISDLKCDVGNQRTITIKVAEEIKNCCGLADIYDIQASRLREGQDFTRICQPQAAFTFTFNDLSTLLTCDYALLSFPICYSKYYTGGYVEEPIVLIMWWDIEMYDKAFICSDQGVGGLQLDPTELNLDVLSCAPSWARSEEMLQRDKVIEDIYKRPVWREHWIQGVYYFQDVLGSRQLMGELCYSSDLIVHCHHDSHSLWFDLTYDPDETLPKNCGCGVHRSLSRSQLGFLNDKEQMTKLLEAIIPLTSKKSYEGTVEFTPRPLMPRHITTLEAPKWSVKLKPVRTFQSAGDEEVEGNQDELTLLDLSLSDEIAWEKVMARFFDEVSIDPILSFTIKCTQVQFESLNRIRTDIATCEGFNLKDLDDMINFSSLLIDRPIESHSLWEYESKRLDFDHEIFSTETLTSEERLSVLNGSYWRHMRFPVRCGYGNWKKGWALVFWAEFTLMRTGKVLSTGPIGRSSIEDPIEWNRYCKQMVYFMHDHPTPPFSNVCVELDIGLSGFHLQIQRPADYNALPINHN